MSKILICDYENAMEESYENTIETLKRILGADTEVEIAPYEDEEELMRRLQGVDGMITAFLKIGEEILSQAPDLKCISVSATGCGSIDREAADRHGVAVCHISEYCTQEVAEHTVALMCALNRSLKLYARLSDEAFRWEYQAALPGSNLCSQTLAVFGFGRIGRRVAELAGAFGMEILAVDERLDKEAASKLGAELVTAEIAFKRADVITNHMNETKENYHFFGKEAFARMECQPIFINAGRGSCVDEEALADALDQKLIRAAGIDVLEAERPNLRQSRLTGRDNVILTPHAAFYSKESIEKLGTISAANLGYFLKGELDKVNSLAGSLTHRK